MKNSFDANLLYQMLKNGSTQEEIAAAFAESLNIAAKRYKEEEGDHKKKLEKAKAVADFYNSYYPNLSITAEEVIQQAEDAKKFFNNLTDIFKI